MLTNSLIYSKEISFNKMNVKKWKKRPFSLLITQRLIFVILIKKVAFNIRESMILT